MTTPHKQAWEHYWRHGSKAGCIQQSSDGYRHEITNTWKQEFSLLNPKSLLDLCCGSGAVLKLAAESLHNSRLVGIDSANLELIEPDPAFEIIPETSIEQLPFPENNFELITSQYGLEYCDFDSVTSEISRVLAPGGSLSLIMHCQTGLTVASAKKSLVFIRFIEQKIAFFDVLKQYIQAMCKYRVGGRQGASAPEFLKVEARWKTALKKLSKGLKEQDSVSLAQNLTSVTEHMFANQHFFTLEQMLDKAKELENFVEMHKSRLLMCNQAAMSKARTEYLIKLLESKSMRCEVNDFIQDESGLTIALHLRFKHGG